MATVVVIASYAPSLINFRGHLLGRMAELGHEVIAVAPDANSIVQSQLGDLGVAYHNIRFSRTGMNADLKPNTTICLSSSKEKPICS